MHNANKTITIYNAYYDSANDVDTYKRTGLTGVSWFGRTKTAVASDGGLNAADEYVLRIPGELCGGYVQPKAYIGTAGTWTLQQGDIIVSGEGPSTGITPKGLFEAYEALTVVGVTDNRNKRGPHIKVVGK